MTLRIMKTYNMEHEDILEIYMKEVRSILELVVPVWHSGLIVRQTQKIERIQKLALLIILGESYINYEVACTLMGIVPLQIRREKLCLRFAQKDLKKENSIFQKKSSNNRSKEVVVQSKCNTQRFQRSSIPYLSGLLNSYCK